MSETFSQRIKDDIAEFISEPTREGLQDLIRYFGGEFDQYELKELWPAIPRIAKTVLAIANSGGGVIIFGIRDATLDPVGLPEFASKQEVFETFRSYLPAPLRESRCSISSTPARPMLRFVTNGFRCSRFPI